MHSVGETLILRVQQKARLPFVININILVPKSMQSIILHMIWSIHRAHLHFQEDEKQTWYNRPISLMMDLLGEPITVW